VVCAAYKWLMSPRGSAFLSVSERLLEGALPHSAGWYAGEDVHASYFGPPLRLASDARRGGRLRTSWHVYNDEADVDRVLDALG
ncbi:MAG: aminotransferase, partial [Actinomycetota bacterium]|nr:aminotransferase [Actinomycetota bacterium]